MMKLFRKQVVFALAVLVFAAPVVQTMRRPMRRPKKYYDKVMSFYYTLDFVIKEQKDIQTLVKKGDYKNALKVANKGSIARKRLVGDLQKYLKNRLPDDSSVSALLISSLKRVNLFYDQVIKALDSLLSLDLSGIKTSSSGLKNLQLVLIMVNFAKTAETIKNAVAKEKAENIMPDGFIKRMGNASNDIIKTIEAMLAVLESAEKNIIEYKEKAPDVVKKNFFGTLGFVISEQKNIQKFISKKDYKKALEVAASKGGLEARKRLKEKLKKDLEEKHPVVYGVLLSFLLLINEVYKLESEIFKSTDISEFVKFSTSLKGLKEWSEMGFVDSLESLAKEDKKTKNIIGDRLIPRMKKATKAINETLDSVKTFVDNVY